MDPTTLVQSLYAAFGRGDVAFVLERLDPKVEWVAPPSAGLPWGGARRGRDGAGQFFAALAQHAEVLRLEVDRFVAQGEVVVALGSETLKSRATGKSYATDFAHVWTLKEGRVVRWSEHFDTAAAVEAMR
jgi:ketosteroid isomerase-like protein